ncbi:MAG: hypothetical protein RMJ97_10695 [Raineya sp.]|nr:hypothetical protein [Raineya sp.]
MNKVLRNVFLVGISLSLMTCVRGRNSIAPEEVEGYKPIYASEEQVNTISYLPPRPLENPGKIYVYGSYLFVGEKGKGVHIFNNANPFNPIAVGFLEIFANNDIAIKNNYLFADNASDLVVLDIANPNEIRLVSRKTNVISDNNFQIPPERGYFECVDNKKGIVIGWEKTILVKPKCRY